MTPQLLLIRHGKTASNSDPGSDADKIRGQADLPIEPKGREQAKELAEKLKAVKIWKIYYSPLQRTAFTAETVAKAQPEKPELAPDKELLSWDLKGWEGKSYNSMMPRLKEFQKDYPSTAPPEGESWNAFLRPWFRAADGFMEEAKKAAAKGLGAVTLVTHTWNLRSLDAGLVAGGGNLEDDYRLDFKTLGADTPAKPGQAYLLEYRNSKWVDGKSF